MVCNIRHIHLRAVEQTPDNYPTFGNDSDSTNDWDSQDDRDSAPPSDISQERHEEWPDDPVSDWSD